LFNFITQPIDTLVSWFGYALLFGGFIITLIVLGVIISIPIGLKMLGIAFAKTVVLETAKIINQLPHDKITLTVDDLKNAGTTRLRSIK
jgi:hypothetical protein